MIDHMMERMIKNMTLEEKEDMMINMMPLMMEGLDINGLIPKMMTAMLQDVTVDDVIEYLKRTLLEKEKFAGFFEKMKDANVMQNMMFKVKR